MNEIDIVVRIIIGILLLISGYIDIKTKNVSVKLVVTCIIPLIIALPFREEITMLEGVLGVLIGIMVLGIGRITKGQIGMGDGLVLVASGIGLGVYNNMRILMYGLLSVAIYSIILLIGRKIRLKTTIPFIPFLGIGYICVMVDMWR